MPIDDIMAEQGRAQQDPSVQNSQQQESASPQSSSSGRTRQVTLELPDPGSGTEAMLFYMNVVQTIALVIILMRG